MSCSTAPVSVIIPCLNAEATLGEALDSVLAQTARVLEILVIDDGSTDRSVAIARSYGAPVRVLRNPQCGPGAARRAGVLEARGVFIAFVDADDVIDPRKHEKQLAILENSDPYTIVHTGSRLYWPDGSRAAHERTGGELATGRCTRVIFERNPVCGASMMIDRSLAIELGNYDPELFGTEDFGMSLKASVFCDYVYLPDCLYHMRQHGGNLTARAAHMAYFHWLAQEKFRRSLPEAFAQLPPESVRKCMIDPILRVAREAYWRREPRGYRRLLHLAMQLVPDDPEIQMLWRRRRIPMRVLRLWDRVSTEAPAQRSGVHRRDRELVGVE